MKCRTCTREFLDGLDQCPYCRTSARPGGRVATKERGGVAMLGDLFERGAQGEDARPGPGADDTLSGLKLEPDLKPGRAEPPPPPSPGPETTGGTTTAGGHWSPTKARVESWAVAGELNHYEVLDVDEATPDEEVQARIQLLDARLERWAGDGMDANAQRIGSSGKYRLFDLREALRDRALYGKEVARQRHERALRRIREEIRQYVERDQTLQWGEWTGLKNRARDAGLNDSELEEILRGFREQGVLTGLEIEGREIRSLTELRLLCDGRGEPLVEPMWGGKLEDWLKRAAEKPELAEQVRQVRAEYDGQRVSGACLILWEIGERRLVLKSDAGGEGFEGLRRWVLAVKNEGYEAASLEALKDRRLENWLGRVLHLDELSEVAARQRGRGRAGLEEILKHVAPRQEQTGPPFTFVQRKAYDLADLIACCDEFPEEAAQYLYNEYFERWLAPRGEAPLALRARQLRKEYEGREPEGLEMFVRSLCSNVGVAPYPRLVSESEGVELGALPVGRGAEAVLTFENRGRGYGWGSVTLEPELPGLKVSGGFDSHDASVELRLDTLRVSPGAYRGEVVVTLEGVPEQLRVPVGYQVAPLQVQTEPSGLYFGKILHGKAQRAGLRVTCTPRDGRLRGRARIEPAVAGVSVSGRLDGAASDLQVDVNTLELEPGRRYQTFVKLDTNVGGFEVPVSFEAALRWDIVAGWTVGASLAAGILMLLTRLALAGGDSRLSGWFLSYSDASTGVLVSSGVFAAVVVAASALLIYLKVLKGRGGLSKKGKA